MADPLRSVTADAMALDPADRLRLAYELIDSVEGPPNDDWSLAWSQELDRRLEKAERTGDYGRPWEEVRADLLKGIARS